MVILKALEYYHSGMDFKKDIVNINDIESIKQYLFSGLTKGDINV